MIFVFDCFRLDVQERLLEGNGKRLTLAPKVFDLLLLFVQNSGKLLEKEWFLSNLWPDTFVEEANLSVNISALRRALDSAGGAHCIETIPKRGYRFVVEVKALRPPLETVAATPEPQASSPTIPLGAYLLGAAIALLAIAALYLGISCRHHSEEGLARPQSIALLAFQPLPLKMANIFEMRDSLSERIVVAPPYF